MPGKMTKSILRPPFRLPQVPAAVRSSRLSCGKVGKAQIFTSARESSGESRTKGQYRSSPPAKRPIEVRMGSQYNSGALRYLVQIGAAPDRVRRATCP
jgi:hypothetical protein